MYGVGCIGGALGASRLKLWWVVTTSMWRRV